MEYRATLNWIRCLADQYVIGKLGRNQGARFKIEVVVENFGYESDGNTSRPEWKTRYHKVLSIIITSSHKVFVSTDGSRFTKKVPVESYVNTSNHDSCWSDSGLRKIWDTVTEGYDHCWGHVPDEHRSPPVSANIRTSPCILSTAMDFVEVEWERVDDYFYKLTNVKELKTTLTFGD